MNGYELSRNWFDWCFENPEKISPNHSALYFFAIEHCNRLGWRNKFGFPTEMAKDAIGIKSYTTYIKTLNDLVSFGFIEMIERSKNQYSSNIIALTNFDKALDKALDKAIVKHVLKQDESTCESIDSIVKPITTNKETIKPLTETPLAIFTFDEFWYLYPNKVSKDKCLKKFKSLNDKELLKIKETIKNFISYKPFAEYNHPNPLTYLNQKRWDDEIKSTEQKTTSQTKWISPA